MRREPAVGVFRAVSDAMLVLWVGSWPWRRSEFSRWPCPWPRGQAQESWEQWVFYLLAHSGLLLSATLVLFVIVAVLSRVRVGDFARAALPATVVAAERGLDYRAA